MIPTIVSAILLFALSAFCKAAMDARVFQPRETAFRRYPAWFRDWMQRRGKIPVIKIDDGWHATQAAMFLTIGCAYLLCGTLYAGLGLWVFAAIPVRTLVHGIVFEASYASMK